MTATILIADDNRNIRNILKIDLELQGYRVLEATNGKEALELVHAQRPDLVVLDVMMPVLDGFEVCSRLKGDETTRGIPIIMLTAKTTPEDKFMGRELGADEYLTKPFDPENLEAVILKILEARKRGETLHPLTGLPMWEAVKNEVARRKKSGDNFMVLEGFLEPESFEIYQKKYGSIKADEALKTASEILKTANAEYPEIFLGHAGDNIFYVIADPLNMEQFRKTVTSQLFSPLQLLYDRNDRTNGGIVHVESDGHQAKAGFMRWVWRINDGW